MAVLLIEVKLARRGTDLVQKRTIRYAQRGWKPCEKQRVNASLVKVMQQIGRMDSIELWMCVIPANYAVSYVRVQLNFL